MTTKKELLTMLIDAPSDLRVIAAALGKFAWDSDVTLVTLTREHMQRVLQRYHSGEISSSQLESWANAIEGREDIGFEPGCENLLNEIIYQLANPLLTEAINVNTVSRLRDRLSSA
jgi:hypothetical protein